MSLYRRLANRPTGHLYTALTRTQLAPEQPNTSLARSLQTQAKILLQSISIPRITSTAVLNYFHNYY